MMPHRMLAGGKYISNNLCSLGLNIMQEIGSLLQLKRLAALEQIVFTF